ncbi:hypothetical protein BOTCAL_0077g00170 [Botryotinia calthae]|uniref:Uncharacterized protein n=1 Tax=Botryotinia calthae TaxID=38488 RepID=A0A4Y8D8P0_9HELO|nr:hypothetical protein BOTCAL_0077g00170 [Botryotinia calthae]
MPHNGSVRDGKKPVVQKSTAQKPVSAFSSSSSSGGEEQNDPTTSKTREEPASRKSQRLPEDLNFHFGSSTFNSDRSSGSSNEGTQARGNTPPKSGQIKGSPDNSPRTRANDHKSALDNLEGRKPEKG